jgi:hypothetical protein
MWSASPNGVVAMRDQQHGPPGVQPADVGEQLVFGPRVEGGGRLVEDDQRRVPDERPRQRDALPLPDRKVATSGVFGGEDGVVPVRQRGQVAVGAGGSGGGPDRVEVLDLRDGAETDVLPGGEVVVGEVLEDDGDPPAQFVGVEVRGVSAVPADLAGVGQVEPGEPGKQSGEGWLPRAVLPDQRDDRARRQLHRDVAQCRRLGGGVGEGDLLDADPLEGLRCGQGARAPYTTGAVARKLV